MPRIPEDTKTARQNRLVSLLRRHPEGLSESEIAEQLGIERRTTNNYLRDLEIEGVLYKESIFWVINPYHQAQQLHRLELSPEQAVTLYLATRLLVKQSDKRNEAAESALFGLAEMLTGELSVSDDIRQAARELGERPGDADYSNVFRTIVRGYLYKRAVEIKYAPRGQRPFSTTIHPYLLEPSAIGFTTYVIGYSSAPNALRTYKLERIQTATLTNKTFTIPADFPGLEILRSAWSIIYGEETVEVVLRFHPSVIDRVLETRWHPSEQKVSDPDCPGWLRWSAQIADTTDMMPWIRGWGADVEVIAPEELRDTMKGEARRLAERYGWTAHRGDSSSIQDDLAQTYHDYFGDE